MKPKPLFLTALACAAVVALALAPRSSHGQADTADDALYAPLVTEVVKQQALIVQNHAKMDEKLGVIAEELRLARIFAARAGGKGTGK